MTWSVWAGPIEAVVKETVAMDAFAIEAETIAMGAFEESICAEAQN